MCGFGVHAGDRERASEIQAHKHLLDTGRGSARLHGKTTRYPASTEHDSLLMIVVQRQCSAESVGPSLLLLVDHGHGGNARRLWFSLEPWSRSVCWILRFTLSPVRGAWGPWGTSVGEIYKRDNEMQKHSPPLLTAL